MATVNPLAPEALYHTCDPAQFSFETTDELDAAVEMVGQERAEKSMRFGIGIKQDGYNLFALGPTGIGKHTAIQQYLEQKAAAEPTPPDWCYVHNFEQSHRPNALHLPAGQGIVFAQDMKKLVEELFTVIPATFESEEYQMQRQAIAEEFQGKQEENLEALNKRAQEKDITLVRTQTGLAFAPIQDGEVISPDEFMKMPEDERESVQNEINELQEELRKIMRQMPQWSRKVQERVQELNREVTTFAVAPLIEELREKYADFQEVLDYLEDVQQDITENVDKFLPSESSPQQQQQQSPSARGDFYRSAAANLFFNRYKVNVLVDHSQTDGAPIVYENLPTYQNLIGRIENVAQMGTLVTDFTLIKPGALHRANGGYLLLDARKVLLQSFSWEGLKRALSAGQIHIESLGQTLGLVSTVSLEPEPIPLDVKVVLLGERLLYYMLYQLDPDFSEFFKVQADFEEITERNSENNLAYAQLIGRLAQKKELRPFHKTAVARIIEHSSRITSDVEKLSTHMESITDLLRESDYWAQEAGDDVVKAAHVQEAIDNQIYRASRIRERVQESILRETILVDTSGEKVGQINGLSVLTIGNYAFGRPSRITARVRMGKGEVVDIERQVEMGGPIHSKGVLILSGFLGGRYASERPLSLSASLGFEQSYGGIDGDSASSAELYALLSALSEVPIQQKFAVTGSVNQHGQVQAIGGANEKIEGFFDICQARGLTGDQGVLIPAANVKNLMLRQDVVEAVDAGKFHIYPIETIDQGIELLTGIPAGEADEEGNYPEDTINYLVAQRLTELAEKQRDFAKPKEEEKDEEEA